MHKFFSLKKKTKLSTGDGPSSMKPKTTAVRVPAGRAITPITSTLMTDEENSLLAPEILPGLVKSTSFGPQDTVPTEVTVLEGDTKSGEDMEATKQVSQVEAQEYLHQLRDTQNLVDQLTMDLNRSRLQVAELIKHNTTLLDELKATAGKDNATLEEHRMLRQELVILKGCLFLGALFICCGGRADVVGILAFVWILGEIFVY